MKVAHHGSRTSSQPTFIALAAPRVAVISLGLDNKFNHPAPEVIARYRAHMGPECCARTSRARYRCGSMAQVW